MINLSVNINKIATIRNARGGCNPSVSEAAIKCQEFGADGITVHPRPDQRHITKADILTLKDVVFKEYNIEGYPSVEFINMVTAIKPTQVTLVPDPPDVITSSSGWDTIKFKDLLKEVVLEFHQHNIRTSIFIEPNIDMIESAIFCDTDRIELYTGEYAVNYDLDRERAIQPYILAAEKASSLGLGINAGHDLNLQNLGFFAQRIPFLSEVSIGHALISDALYLGMENTIQMYKRLL